MLIWLIFALMTGAAAFAVLWPLSRSTTLSFGDAASATSLYRAQLSEIDRDVSRGLLADAEAQAARNEAARRVLRAADAEAEPSGESEGSLRRRRAASAIALSTVPLLALLAYGALGSPHLPDLPLSARLRGDPAGMDMNVALARIETHLGANPADVRGWEIVAPVYLRQGRYEDAARAFRSAIEHGGRTAERYAGLGESQTLAAGGIVTAEARDAFADALAIDAGNARARYFLAIAQEQDGDRLGALERLRALLAEAAPDSPWGPTVSARIARLEGETGTAPTVGGLAQGDQMSAIRGMVAGLAARLKDGGGTLDEWSRLIRSRIVLDERPAALEALETARLRLAEDASAASALDRLAAELGLGGSRP